MTYEAETLIIWKEEISKLDAYFGTSQIDLLARHASERRGTHTHNLNHKSPVVTVQSLYIDAWPVYGVTFRSE